MIMKKKVSTTKTVKYPGCCNVVLAPGWFCGVYSIGKDIKAGCGHRTHICTKCFNAGKIIDRCVYCHMLKNWNPKVHTIVGQRSNLLKDNIT
jgi:hypothetical protein